MELDDPISDKFRTLLEALMAKTTSEIVKVFADVLLETRVEISRSWKKIDELKQELERREEQREKSKSQTTQVTFKWEENDVQQNPSHENPQISVSVPCTDESIVIESQVRHVFKKSILNLNTSSFYSIISNKLALNFYSTTVFLLSAFRKC